MLTFIIVVAFAITVVVQYLMICLLSRRMDAAEKVIIEGGEIIIDLGEEIVRDIEAIKQNLRQKEVKKTVTKNKKK